MTARFAYYHYAPKSYLSLGEKVSILCQKVSVYVSVGGGGGGEGVSISFLFW